MQPDGFDFYAIGDAALELGVARSNLRYFIDLGKVPCRRASDGSRLMSRDDLQKAREWIDAHEEAKSRARNAARKGREAALRKIRARGAKAKLKA